MPRSLEWYHRVGRYLCELNTRSPYGANFVRTAAQQLNQSHATFYRAMQLAEKYPGRAIQSLQGLSFAAVKVLLAVKDDRLRQDLQQQAVRQGWSARRLQLEVKLRQGAHAARGGRRREPATEKADLAELAAKSQNWLRFSSEVWHPDRLDALEGGIGNELVRRIRTAVRALQSLVQAIENASLVPGSA
jgi:hypothetical protein